jgi:hypothetical protein
MASLLARAMPWPVVELESPVKLHSQQILKGREMRRATAKQLKQFCNSILGFPRNCWLIQQFRRF